MRCTKILEYNKPKKRETHIKNLCVPNAIKHYIKGQNYENKTN